MLAPSFGMEFFSESAAFWIEQSQPGQEMWDSPFLWRQHGDWGGGKMPFLPSSSSSSSSLAAGKRGLLFVIDLLMLAIVRCVLRLIG